MAEFQIELQDVQTAPAYALNVRAVDLKTGEGVVDSFI